MKPLDMMHLTHTCLTSYTDFFIWPRQVEMLHDPETQLSIMHFST